MWLLSLTACLIGGETHETNLDVQRLGDLELTGDFRMCGTSDVVVSGTGTLTRDELTVTLTIDDWSESTTVMVDDDGTWRWVVGSIGDFATSDTRIAVVHVAGFGDEDDGEFELPLEAGALWFPDEDGDEFGDGESVESCEAPPGHVALDGDCADDDADIHPDATEVCDGVDNDCDLLAEEADPDLVANARYPDVDGDGFGDDGAVPVEDCALPDGWAAVAGDCDDEDESTHPDADEVCDGVDNDCDDAVDDDDDDLTAPPVFADGDDDGFGDPNVMENRCLTSGWIASAVPADCDDDVSSVNPAATEVCDGIDNNCSGVVDDADETGGDARYLDVDGDGYGDDAQVEFDCTLPLGWVTVGGDCDDQEASTSPGAEEVCDGVDNDCDDAEDDADDGLVSVVFADADGDGFGDPGNMQTGCPTEGWVESAEPADCDDDDPLLSPNAAEVCDGFDNDCDDAVDDDDDDRQGGDLYFEDSDGDGYGVGVLSCESPPVVVDNDADCDDDSALISPDAVEVCDGVDNNCDSVIDESIGSEIWSLTGVQYDSVSSALADGGLAYRICGTVDWDVGEQTLGFGETLRLVGTGSLSGTLQFSGGALALEGVTLEGGPGVVNGMEVEGGAIHLTSTDLYAHDVTIRSREPSSVDNGGCLHALGSDVDLEDVVFEDCHAVRGGALYFGGGTLRGIGPNRSVIRDSTAFLGGGVFLSGDAVVSGIELSNNNAVMGSGGGLHVPVWDSFVTLSDLGFHDNTADLQGGGLMVRSANVGVFTLSDSEFHGNTANEGGAAKFRRDAILTNVDFHSNSSMTGAAALAIETLNFEVDGGVFQENTGERGALTATAFEVGGALIVRDAQFVDNVADTQGGAMDVVGVSVVVERTEFTGNSSTLQGGAVAVREGAHGCGPVTITDTEFLGNQVEMFSSAALFVRSHDPQYACDAFLTDVQFRDSISGTSATTVSILSHDMLAIAEFHDVLFDGNGLPTGAAAPVGLLNTELRCANCTVPVHPMLFVEERGAFPYEQAAVDVSPYTGVCIEDGTLVCD